MNLETKYQEHCARPSDINQHLPTLRRYAQECRTVVEMGVRTIVSTWAFLAARPASLVSVDYIHPRDHGGNLEEVYALVEGEGIAFNFLQADTREIEIAPTDLLFIDTWHVYEQLKVELERHASKVQKFIILHDTVTFGECGETAGHRGLQPALQEFLETDEGKKWQVGEVFTNCNGLTVLQRVLL